MKKLSTLLITLIFVLSLSACTPENNSGGKTKAQNTTNPIQSTQDGDNIQSSVSDNSVTQQPTQSSSEISTVAEITRERAIEIALNQAGAVQSEIRDLDVELDRERGKPVWEIDFEHGNLEYSFDIDAVTGEILENESEYD